MKILTPLIEIRNLEKTFCMRGFLRTGLDSRVLRGISLTVERGETLGLVGESGSGKSTIGKCLLRLTEPTRGEILFKGKNILTLPKSEMKLLRRKMQIIFQDPYSSLNPRFTLFQILEEPLVIHGLYPDKILRMKRVHELMDLVGLSLGFLKKYPHELSGGQRQRVGIARALAVEPEFIVCDEPVSALDVSIQAQVLNLLLALQKELKLTYLFISHDLKVVQHMSHRIAVIYLGQIVEFSDNLCEAQKHPYTQALLSSIPIPDPSYKRSSIILEGDIPSPTSIPSGCAFHTRCFKVEPRCRLEVPHLKPTKQNAQHVVSCLLVE